ncbi:TetR/AcrR family transcriptional regulator [Clostridium saccharobutylicum]|uniref:Transcriptional regulator n=1 Tax=Clostridium saccharobutylicum DSM 13864 TaxID=1345695 RepID=U5MV06_CLOSA|nr:TetR/AcrR family transcriptional regulator [Clostridium saccharobutylicum]AGX43297.1 transcriptional regulator [Clostridium saccharobutylicum DSM 13864]AQR90598.1 fatty acid metabolism regulator protein [Clostridium saccharobutylicum]AQS00502.1 fatty acid metabolism regulator protein [Clostridium saccharobutylicum]AQS10153.1 fatty acid metabolism regulator protein [Clostridium saccharobutylicum]AQS14485.1 fatty acid metabolism regulator protein [Clostridium saccharobutylicum]
MGISLLHRKERIIISTIEVINEVGLQNLSTKLIAAREGVSEGTLFRHYKNKAEIMSAVIDHFSQFDNAIIETTMVRELSPIETIRHFVCSYAEYYENYPAITALVQATDSLMCDHELSAKVKIIIDKRSDFLRRAIQDGQNGGTIKSNISSELLEDLITGGSREICLKWRIAKFKFSIRDKTSEMLDILLDAFTEKNNK